MPRPFTRSTIVLALLAVGVASLPVGTSEAATNRVLNFGVYSPPAPEGGLTRISTLESQLQDHIEIVELFQAWGDGTHGAFHPKWIKRARANGRKALVTWEPQIDWTRGADQPEYTLGKIIRGRFDKYIKSWAQGLANLDRTVYLRPMHEMNGTWFPWGGTVNGNKGPRQFKRAWIHIWTIFHRNGADKVRWVWSPNAQDVPHTVHFERYYPGGRYVDVLSIDGYNWNDPAIFAWRSFKEIFSKAYRRVRQLGHKPIWVGETATASTGDRATWIKNMFAALANGFPRIKAVIWFDAVGAKDWRIGNDSNVLQAFRNGLNRF
jgi:mannan endo-1,4-beta-mannosidase